MHAAPADDVGDAVVVAAAVDGHVLAGAGRELDLAPGDIDAVATFVEHLHGAGELLEHGVHAVGGFDEAARGVEGAFGVVGFGPQLAGVSEPGAGYGGEQFTPQGGSGAVEVVAAVPVGEDLAGVADVDGGGGEQFGAVVA